MDFKQLFYTVRDLEKTQIVYQLLIRVRKPKFLYSTAPLHQTVCLKTEFIDKYTILQDDSFSFLNLNHQFSDWNYDGNGALFAYNQNYFDFINQKDISVDDACKWIDKFIEEIPTINQGLDPYPIALRGINWVKFFTIHPECISREREDSLWSQLKLLEKKLEYHLLGNHLLEDAFSLYIGAVYFEDAKLLKKAEKLLCEQLKEQTLNDGGHYEQSPMYHCILLDRLLDCINFRRTDLLVAYAQKQIGWLKSICYSDGSFPLLNDSAFGIAPTPAQILDYAIRLGIDNEPTPLSDSGYRKMSGGGIEAIIDIGSIKASYQPGHSHADTFNFELRIDGKPFVVDTGISTYEKNARRQYERGTMAHNCVVVDGKNSSEVWGGFRVGKRAKVTILEDSPTYVKAYHSGYKKKCYRTFSMVDGRFIVEDQFEGDAISYLHLPADVDLDRIKIENSLSIEIKNGKASKEYNTFYDILILEIHFCNYLKISIQ